MAKDFLQACDFEQRPYAEDFSESWRNSFGDWREIADKEARTGYAGLACLEEPWQEQTLGDNQDSFA
jgi:hypothetical protein